MARTRDRSLVISVPLLVTMASAAFYKRRICACAFPLQARSVAAHALSSTPTPTEGLCAVIDSACSGGENVVLSSKATPLLQSMELSGDEYDPSKNDFNV